MKLLFQNDDFAIVSKPAGMNFHSEDEAGFVVLASEMLDCKLFPVHRLDKMTSGLVILAKSSEVANAFLQLFESRKIEKYYLAISLRKPKKKMGKIVGDMAKGRRGSWKLMHTKDNPAITRFISVSLNPGEKLFLVKPYTGKTHQIRVAMKSVGSPIAGDERYAAAEDAKKLDRGYLHAYALKFDLNGDSFSFKLPPDEGELFLTKECQGQIMLWDKPEEFFK
ncbi:TIGR01621 family pseudouridine synthase [Sulfurimonas sp. C5]|uniref:TIGR01621 family pseudouridine synthase n=1 Tax=Sulfurimonas sp. C5 TaxID=3036947 RepID=UPI0024557896|nr:TIGR01621 family pseudouridine synthase [Sulfurimonas sp. C5]MDH4943519.1 TIGR01621 family pseudouridine synthase [Sulfurimonas sp. C5]